MISVIKKESIFYIAIILLIAISFSASFYKYVLLKDYIVAYEYECDPLTESCFIGCEDEECASQYFYAIIEKKAYDVYSICGENVPDCTEAFVCSEEDTLCNIIYCDPESISGNECSSSNDIES